MVAADGTSIMIPSFIFSSNGIPSRPPTRDSADPSLPTLVACRSGLRSYVGTRILKQHGFADVSNVAGGINAWALEIDSSVPTY